MSPKDGVQEDEGRQSCHIPLLEDPTHEKSSIVLVVLNDEEQDGQQ